MTHGSAIPSFRETLQRDRVVGILRGAPVSSLPSIAQAVRLSGLTFLEVTLNTPGACEQIRILSDLLNGICQIGAGTVLDPAAAQEAAEAGARFLVSPGYFPALQDWANHNGIPTLPGALTPTEIWNAWSHGAALVKVFPARSVGGPAYFKELRGPFGQVGLLACGGVSAENAGEYVRSGADALAFGGSIFSKARLESGDMEAMARDIRALLGAARQPAISR
ncbi:MAG TPA: bifunctional 4-hydroxy-2-oxoglutarate aldolase/2-dehydro-3-deoxy-phosphogluconate aldolase [Fibrobacteria bacterium]|nr:bifunctional 4-hydroxy-2-oxoglutarate aldolase/2-dehydro-3-deoxy-phosphogluconate aldolase [Fibrobacteria bacterium]HOX52626.1 bifunctional 4-hydroxy-2-oxoglutarate aldolase/2-dehydro-3-deoxy-phosphogluconate aldolase [Fibrobacteria bacterium]